MSEPTTAYVGMGETMPLGAKPIDMRLLPQTYRWPRRLWTWVWWKCIPFRWITRLLLPKGWNPYRKVVALVRLDPIQVPETTTRQIEAFTRGGDHDPPMTDDHIAASPLFRRSSSPPDPPPEAASGPTVE